MVRSLGRFDIAVPVYERRLTDPANPNRGYRQEQIGTRAVTVDVRVDVEGLAGSHGRQAAKNKSRRCVDAGGLVEVVVVKEAR